MGRIVECINMVMGKARRIAQVEVTAGRRKRLRYDWFLRRWVHADYVMAVTVGGPFHGQPIRIPREGLNFSPLLYTRHDFEWRIPFPLRFTAVVAAGAELPPRWEVQALADNAKVIRWAGAEECMRISCLATGVPYGR